MYDFLIKDGLVMDFEQNKLIQKDVALQGGKIAEVGEGLGEGKETISAKGKVISPGFIDIHMHEEFAREGSDEIHYDISNHMLLMGVTTAIAGNCGNNRFPVDFFRQYIREHGAPVNYLTYIGHNYLREQVGITDRYREATSDEIDRMKELLLKAFHQGVIGISFGLEYSPGVTLKEVEKLVTPFKSYPLILAAHYRKDAKYALDSIREMIEISRRTSLPMIVSHISSCAAFGMMDEALDIIRKAREEGLDISVDTYPYNAFSTFIGSAVFDDGCFDLWGKGPEIILLTEEPYKGHYCDMELFQKVRKEHPKMLVATFAMDEEDIEYAVAHKDVMIASDGLLREGQGHPRAAGTFPRILGRYVREKNVLSLEDALYKMTLLPAKRLGLEGRKGMIKKGYDADLVIFDPDTIIDEATFENPILPPKGIDYVFLSGKPAVKGRKILRKDLGSYIDQPLTAPEKYSVEKGEIQ